MERGQAFALYLLLSLASCVTGWTSNLQFLGFETKAELEAAVMAAVTDAPNRTPALSTTASVLQVPPAAVPQTPVPSSANSSTRPSMGGTNSTSPNFIVVAADGSGDYQTVQAGIDAAPNGTRGKRTTVFIKAGDYFEKVVVPSNKTFLTVMGEKGTRVFFNKRAADFEDRKTAKTASFSVFADDFVAINVTFENTYGWPNGSDYAQAVALLAAGDRVAFYNCTFLGHQDTLFALSGRQYYRNCTIVGSVDFIFGNARALFDGCLIRVISNDQNPYTAVAAHFRQSLDENTGFVFLGGSLVGLQPVRLPLELYKVVLLSLVTVVIAIAAKLKGPLVYTTNLVWLGRLWGPYCTIVYANVRMEDFIQPTGWTMMSNATYTETALVYGYNNSGPGWSTAAWVPWAKTVLNSTEAAHFLGLQYIHGASWL